MCKRIEALCLDQSKSKWSSALGSRPAVWDSSGGRPLSLLSNNGKCSRNSQTNPLSIILAEQIHLFICASSLRHEILKIIWNVSVFFYSFLRTISQSTSNNQQNGLQTCPQPPLAAGDSMSSGNLHIVRRRHTVHTSCWLAHFDSFLCDISGTLCPDTTPLEPSPDILLWLLDGTLLSARNTKDPSPKWSEFQCSWLLGSSRFGPKSRRTRGIDKWLWWKGYRRSIVCRRGIGVDFYRELALGLPSNVLYIEQTLRFWVLPISGPNPK